MPTPKTVQSVETAFSSLPPPYGAIFAGVFKFIEFTGYFDQPDPTLRAIELLQKEIDAIRQDLDQLQNRVNQLTERVAQDENGARLTRLNDIRLRLASLLNRIKNQPASVSERDAIAFDAGQLADQFLDDADLWRWTDLETTWTLDNDGHESAPKQVNLLPADFKSQVAEPVYVMAILTWITAIDLDTGGNAAVVGQKYGVQLRRHIGQCRVRDGFDDLRQPPVTLPENVMTRITCRPIAQHKYALDRQCLISIQCENTMLRRTFAVRDVILPMPAGADVACLAPDNLGVLDEREIEDAQGVETTRQLADLLEKVLLTGSLRQQFIGWFGSTPTRGTAFLYTIGQDGVLSWFKQPAVADQATLEPWQGPDPVGTGWQGFTKVYPAGGNRFYGLQTNGDLLWYRHDGFNDGSVNWQGPVRVGTGWQEFKAIIPGSDGVLYAMQPDGALFWYNHFGYRDGAVENSWAPRQQVGTGWQNFKTVFSVGSGVLYAVANDGSLLWYRHDGFEDGSFRWQGPVPVGNGWQNFRDIFGVSDGVIFAVQPNGDVLRYEHTDWKTGGPNWREPVMAARGFAGYRQLFPLMPAAPDPIH